jgi:hypothetical protein
MTFLQESRRRCNMQSWPCRGIYKYALAIFILVAFLFLHHVSFAVDNFGKYEVVSGSDDKAYLVDTSTGAVWILTYRTMATGREPIAIPFKFIQISPKNHNEFLIENSKGPLIPINETKQ